jgi:maltose O-acetyltransferase
LLYNANYDKELINERIACKDLCLEYNGLKNLMQTEEEKRWRKL